MERFSVIIPVYNRPDEVAELLDSLTKQTYRNYEIILVEDGSSVPCEEVVKQYADKLPISYYTKPNSGPGQSRNYGAERAKGEYLLIWDSDILVPAILKRLKLSWLPIPSMRLAVPTELMSRLRTCRKRSIIR